MRRFENIRVFAVPIPPFSRCQCAVTLPGIGILVSPDVTEDVALLRHEFGHILQRRKFGWLFFRFWIVSVIFFVVPVGLKYTAAMREILFMIATPFII